MFEIPKVKVNVLIYIEDKTKMNGVLYLEKTQYNQEPDLEHFLNEPNVRFLPFKEKEGSVHLLNKNRVVWVCIEDKESQRFEEELLIKPIHIKPVFKGNSSLACLIYPSLPSDKMRASDFFNQDRDFLPVYTEGKKFIINSSYIEYIDF